MRYYIKQYSQILIYYFLQKSTGASRLQTLTKHTKLITSVQWIRKSNGGKYFFLMYLFELLYYEKKKNYNCSFMYACLLSFDIFSEVMSLL